MADQDYTNENLSKDYFAIKSSGSNAGQLIVYDRIRRKILNFKEDISSFYCRNGGLEGLQGIGRRLRPDLESILLKRFEKAKRE